MCTPAAVFFLRWLPRCRGLDADPMEEPNSPVDEPTVPNSPDGEFSDAENKVMSDKMAEATDADKNMTEMEMSFSNARLQANGGFL